MADLTPIPGWDAVPRLELSTLAAGGEGGPMNAQAQALLNRLAQLKLELNSITSALVGAGMIASSDALAYAPGTVGAKLKSIGSGLNNATVLLFQRTATATPPALPSVNVTYDFGSAEATGVNNG